MSGRAGDGGRVGRGGGEDGGRQQAVHRSKSNWDQAHIINGANVEGVTPDLGFIKTGCY